MAASGQLDLSRGNPTHDNSSSDDDEIIDVPVQKITIPKTAVKGIVAEMLKDCKNKLNFNTLLRQLGEKGDSDLEGEEDFVEESVMDIMNSITPMEEDTVEKMVPKESDDEEKDMDVEEDTGKEVTLKEITGAYLIGQIFIPPSLKGLSTTSSY